MIKKEIDSLTHGTISGNLTQEESEGKEGREFLGIKAANSPNLVKYRSKKLQI